MKKLVANFIIAIVAIIGIGVLYYTIKAYFMIGVGDGYYYDGWGRTLYNPPWWVAWLWSDMQYPGLKWFAIDTVGFWIALGICGGLIQLSSLLRESK